MNVDQYLKIHTYLANYNTAWIKTNKAKVVLI